MLTMSHTSSFMSFLILFVLGFITWSAIGSAITGAVNWLGNLKGGGNKNSKAQAAAFQAGVAAGKPDPWVTAIPLIVLGGALLFVIAKK